VSIEKTHAANMSIFRQFFDTSRVYVDEMNKSSKRVDFFRFSRHMSQKRRLDRPDQKKALKNNNLVLLPNYAVEIPADEQPVG